MLEIEYNFLKVIFQTFEETFYNNFTPIKNEIVYVSYRADNYSVRDYVYMSILQNTKNLTIFDIFLDF